MEQPPADPERADIVGRHRKLGARTALIAGFTLLSRVLGYVREFLAALLFGDSSPVYDAFVTAWRVPNLFRRLLGEGAVATALQTSMTEADGDRGNAAGRRLFWDTLRLGFALCIGVAAVAMGLATVMGDTMPWTGWRWLGEDPAAVRELVIRLVPFVVVICLAGLAGGGLAVRGRFAGASAGPAVMNTCVIVTLVGIGLTYGWTGLTPEDGAAGRERHLDMARMFAWGMLAAGMAQLLVLTPDLRKAGLLGRASSASPALRLPALPGEDTGWSVLRASLPLALGAAVYQINVMVDGFMAQGMLTRGGPTTYYFANRLQQLPLALVATAATSAVFPVLKALGHERRHGELRLLHDRTQLMVVFLALPASAGLFVLAEPVVDVLLGHGEFGPEGVERTARALRVLCLSLLPAGAVGLVSRAYYAIGDFKTPVRISIAMLVLNIALNVLFLVGLDMDVEGLALSTTFTSWGNLAILLPGLRRRVRAPQVPEGVAPGPSEPARDLIRIAASSAAMVLAVRTAHEALAGRVGEGLALIATIAFGAMVYAGCCQLLGVPQWAALRRRFRGAQKRG